MSAAQNLAAPELGAHAPKVMGDPRNAGRREFDDVNDVFALARRVANGTTRDVTGLSVDEVRLIAATLAVTADVVARAAELFARSDAGADRAEMRRHLAALAEVTRPFMGDANGQI